MGTIRNAQRGETFSGYTTLEIHTCPVCGVTYAAPERLFETRRDDGKSFWCPNGHSLSFHESTADRLKRQLAEEKARVADEQKRLRATRDLLAAEERSHSATRGHLTRAKKRIGNGVCPCCNRHFTNVERHMESQHPGFAT